MIWESYTERYIEEDELEGYIDKYLEIAEKEGFEPEVSKGDVDTLKNNKNLLEHVVYHVEELG